MIADGSTSAQSGYIGGNLSRVGTLSSGTAVINGSVQASGTATEDSTGALNFVVTGQWSTASDASFTSGFPILEIIR